MRSKDYSIVSKGQENSFRLKRCQKNVIFFHSPGLGVLTTCSINLAELPPLSDVQRMYDLSEICVGVVNKEKKNCTEKRRSNMEDKWRASVHS